MPKIVLPACMARRPARHGLAFVTDLCIATEDAKFTPAYAKIGGLAGRWQHRRHGRHRRRAPRLPIFLAEDSFTAQQAMIGGWWPGSFRRRTEGRHKAVCRAAGAQSAAAIGATKALVYQAATASTKAQLDAEAEKIVDCMQSEDFPRGGEEIHQQVEVSMMVPRVRSSPCAMALPTGIARTVPGPHRQRAER